MALPTPEEQEAYDKLSPEEKAKLANEVEEKAKKELDKLTKKYTPFVTVGLVAIIGGCVALINNGGGSVKEPREFTDIYAKIWSRS